MLSLKTRHLQALLPPTLKADVRNLSFYYGDLQVLKSLTVPVMENKVTALIGASGCGKTTLLRCFNRLHDLYSNTRYEGEIMLYPDEYNIVAPHADPMLVRFLVGMVFQKPNPFPRSVFENVASGLRAHGERHRVTLQDKVEEALIKAALWHEVKDKLTMPAYHLSGGQQQRLCIARALATSPSILLLDEPTSALDPVATAHIEELISHLSQSMTILMVTHNMQQAARIADYTAYMHDGQVLEYGLTDHIFMNPAHRQTEDFITGRRL
jgi:phosphate transport system ATP-binding protein